MNYPQYALPDTQSMPSGSIWADCPTDDFKGRSSNVPAGFFRHIDFADFRTSSNVNAAQAFWERGLKVFGSDGGSIATLDERPGGSTFAADGDDEGVSVGQMHYPFRIDRGLGNFWFECRIKTSTITDTKHGFLLGLIDASSLSATVPIAAAGTLADENLVGFFRPEGDGDGIDTVYKANGVTAVTVGANAVVPVADTWMKLGMTFKATGDPVAQNRLTFWLNGAPLADGKVIPTADGTDFPNDVNMGFVFALLNATATTPGSTSLSWAQICQLY